MIQKPILILLVFCSFLSFKNIHKYYVSVTTIEHVKEKKEVQIISRIFIDDLETALQARYNQPISFDKTNTKTLKVYVEKYLTQKFQIEINQKQTPFVFLGYELEDGMVLCYLEIDKIKKIKTIKTTTTILQEIYPEQENIVRFKMNNQNKSFLLHKENPNTLLNFN